MAKYANFTTSTYGKGEQATICSFLKISLHPHVQSPTVDIPEVLRRAWVRMRFEQPDIACFADNEKSIKVYKVPDERSLRSWLDQSFHVMPVCADARSAYPDLEITSAASLYWLPQSSEVMLRAPHWMIDGMGTVMFWDAFFNLVRMEEGREEVYAWGEELRRLSPAMEKVWGYEQGTAERVKEVTDSFMSFIGKYPSIGPTNTAGKVPPTRCAMAELVLDESLTETLISICKCQGISVTSAIEACFILALQAHAAPS